MSEAVTSALHPLTPAAVQLRTGMDLARREASREYLRTLTPRNLLLNHLLEAGLTQINEKPDGIHWGWESPTSMVRSHFVGNWMSAMAYYAATTNDTWAKGILDHVVTQLGACQQANGGEWLAGIPEKFLHWIKQGRAVWAPMYIVHRNMMGLLDAHMLTGNDLALELVINQARWLTRFTDGMTDPELDDLLDWETGGMQEVLADLYGLTGAEEHRELLRRFDRRRLIERLLAGEDPLTNMHANQTAQEIVAAARAYEVTGDERWRKAVEAYWRCAVTDRGSYATGGQTFGEFWPPPNELAARLGKTNQEHCVVFHMSRLATHLLRWTGDAQYADYLERNRYNGLFAQQHPHNGMVAYYLPLGPGHRKEWSTPTETFSCCLATSVQAQAQNGLNAYFTDQESTLVIAQYIASRATWSVGDIPVTVTVHTYEVTPDPGKADFEHDFPAHRPTSIRVEIDIAVDSETDLDFSLKLRLPWWLSSEPELTIDGQAYPLPFQPGTFQEVRAAWSSNRVSLTLPKTLVAVGLPDQPDTVAFMDGPTVLAGKIDHRCLLRGEHANPTSILEPHSELELGVWQGRWITKGQDRDVEFVPLHEIIDEPYTVYFSVQPHQE